METYDCVVVGAGCFGLAAAKQYRTTHPGHSIRIFGSEATLGGTWAEERLYPGLKTNNLFGTVQFPDFPMDPERFGVKEDKHVPGTAVHEYLEAYAAHFGIHESIRLRTKVVVAEHREGKSNPEGGWILTVVDLDKEEKQKSEVYARRLIVASGLTSEPFVPRFQGQGQFGGRIFHTKYFKQNSDTLKTCKTVTILGGNKSSWDAVDVYARAGFQVNWVIRSTGTGPCWMSPSHVSPLKKRLEGLAHTRLITWFSPCIWGDKGGFKGVRSFLHSTWVGRSLVNGFWAMMAKDVCDLNAYDSHPKTALLKPWLPFIFLSTHSGVLNYDSDFFELVKSDKINIHIAEIDHLSPGRVHLSNGTSFESEVIMANCGWKHDTPIKFLPEGIEGELGLPHQQSANAVPDDLGNRADLLDRADNEILGRFRRLVDQPALPVRSLPTSAEKSRDAAKSQPQTMFMMYRFMIPPSPRFLRTRDVAFCGMLGSYRPLTHAHLQGLWISSYFDGWLANDPSQAIGDGKALESLQYETVLHNRFCRWRHPTDHSHPAVVLDSMSYWDMLMKDMGLNARRKQKQGMIAEITSPYGTEDYAHINDEWERRRRLNGRRR